MFLVEQLRLFFADLQDKDYESAIATVHSRFSTNTNPSWERAHPNRFIVHNGEINTIKGNADKMLAREETMESEFLKGELQKVLPVVNTEGSDSAMLDNTLEFLVMSGMDLPLAVMILIPEPWANNSLMSQKKKDFYQYYATMMEPWDGPASILFSDGDIMGAVLDRNGLRPSRYYITDDDYLILSSEVGVLDIDPTKIVVKERLRPGKMLLVDTVKGRVIDDDELKETYAGKQPYGEWIDRNLLNLKDLKIPNQRVPEYTKEERQRMQKAFGYTYESLRDAILPMAKMAARERPPWVLIHRLLHWQPIISRYLTTSSSYLHRLQTHRSTLSVKSGDFHNRIHRRGRKPSGRKSNQLPGVKGQQSNSDKHGPDEN